jgi:hypothetical protein
LRFRLPAQSLRALRAAVALAPICLLTGCNTLGSKGGFAACQAADTGTTLYVKEHGARELNPVVDAILTATGPVGFITAKAGVTLLVAHEYAALSRDLVAVASGVTCAAAANNVNVGRRLAAEKKAGP